jgi:hypothetical protein
MTNCGAAQMPQLLIVDNPIKYLTTISIGHCNRSLPSSVDIKRGIVTIPLLKIAIIAP